MVALYEKKSSRAKELYRKAIELKSNNSTAHQRLAWMLTTNETLDDAIAEMRLAQKSDPISIVTNLNLTRLLRLNRKPDEAMVFCKRALEMDPSSSIAKGFLAEIYEQKKDYPKAAAELEAILKKTPEDLSSTLILSRVYAKDGQKKKARSLLEEARKLVDTGYSYEIATIHLALGEKAKAFETLNASKENSLIYFLHIKYDTNLDEIRKDPAFEKILSDSTERLDSAYK